MTRVLRRRLRSWLFVLASGAVLVSMAVLRFALPPHRNPIVILLEWLGNSAGELRVFLAVSWREPLAVAAIVLVCGALLRLCPSRWRAMLIGILAGVIVALCGMIAIDLCYLLATGQPFSAPVLLFSAGNLSDLLPLIRSEATPLRVALLAGFVVSAAAWLLLRRNRVLAASPNSVQPRLGLIAAVGGAVALVLPLLPADRMPLERFTEATFLSFARTGFGSPMLQAERNVDRAFEKEGRPPWYSAGMRFVPTPATQRKNVVIVMMESVRASSTPMHVAGLASMPFLARLSAEGMSVRDMSAVVPRTAGAWMAVVGGQYPLTNEGTAEWSRENAKKPRIRGLAHALREQGYATGFFTPTHLGLLNEIEVVKALGFETIRSERDFRRGEESRVGYMGAPDEVMVEPIVQWAASARQHGQPFFAAIMTNIGHHPYTLPEGWVRRSYAVESSGVESSDQRHQSYLNCLSYIDGVLEHLLAELKRADVLQDTIFVFVGDHGQFFGEHAMNQVFNALYDEGVHVPATVYAPGDARVKGVVEGARQQVDIVPTIADLLGFAIEGARLPGKSMFSAPDPKRKLFYSGSIESSYLGMRRGSRKYIYDFDRGPLQAFDLATDPKESNPLPVDDEEGLTVKEELMQWQAAARLSMFARPGTKGALEGGWNRR